MDRRERSRNRFQFHSMGFHIHFFTMAVVLILLLFVSGWMDYYHKRIFLLPNWILLCMGIAGCSIFCSMLWQVNRFWGKLGLDSEKLISVLAKVVFFVQIYFCYSAYFYTGWDPAVINYGADELAHGQSLSDIAYFSQYPNNLFLVYLFSLIKRADMYFGVLDVDNGIMCILCVQCFISSLTGFLLFKIVRNIAGYRGAWCAWVCYLVLVGSSGWLLIPYSDSIGLFFPVSLLYLYQQLQNRPAVPFVLPRLKWMAIGALSCLGYHIKPQIMIVFIAIAIAEFLRPKSTKEDGKRLCRGGILYALAGLALASFFYNIMMKDITGQIDADKKFGIAHYIMMGLNPWNNGVYLYSDVAFSESFPTVPDRNVANMEVIGQRLQDMGISGLKTHLAKKLLTNYGDGTFAWKNEGDFFDGIYEPKNSFLSPLLRNIIGGDGEMNLLAETIRQIVWFGLLAASLGFIGYKKSGDNVLLVAAWAIVGLTLFELLFEARARYLYIYAPFYIVTGVLGAGKIRTFLGQKNSVAF